MSDHAITEPQHAGHAAHAGAEDPMSHVPPGSIWPLVVCIALTLMPFGTLAMLGALNFDASDVIGLFGISWKWHVPEGLGQLTLYAGTLLLLFSLMGWAHQIIKEKVISHDLKQMESDLKQFTILFLAGEFSIFGAIFAYFYHRKIWDATFGPMEGMHFGGPMVAYATFILISSSVTCEIAHRVIEHGHRAMGKLLLIITILLGVIFLGFQGYEYGEMIARGFTPAALGNGGPAAFASLFFASTGFHGLHVAIGLVMLFMVLLRLELGHFRGSRHFSLVAASWYWHFVDIVWILLFITVYVVA